MKKRIYLDYSATTPVLPEVASLMEKIAVDHFGNPSSHHQEGREAKAHREKAREIIAASIGALPEEIFFTSGGTESNFLGITGLSKALASKGRHLITSSIEHSSVLGAFKALEDQGFLVTYLPVTSLGMVEPESLAQAIRDDTILVSIMLANNEIGTIQPIQELARIATERHLVFHTDAIQAYPHLPLDVNVLQVDALSLSAHKVYGPKGVGAIYLRRGIPFSPMSKGGEQERKIRPGTENVAGIAGFGKAVEILVKEREREATRTRVLRDQLKNGLFENITQTILNGDPDKRLPNNVNISFREADGESILIHLDLEGIACSMGSACSAGALEPSHVLLALGRTPREAKSAIRFTLGKYTKEEEINHVVKVLPPFIRQLRSTSSMSRIA